MAYPKPLSEKTILKMYKEAKISDAKKKFLHDFFTAAANLYGSIELQTLWEVYKELADKTTVIKLVRKELFAFSEITRREDMPYYIFEIDEVYSEENRKESLRLLVKKDVVGEGYGRFRPLYYLHDGQFGKDPYVPLNLLSFAEGKLTDDQEELLEFLGNLKVSATEYTDSFGKTYPCEHTGEYLKDFEYLDLHEQFEIKYLSGEIENGPKRNDKKLAAFLERCKGPIANRLVDQFLWRISVGWVESSYTIKMVFDELEEIGVQLTENELEELVSLLNRVQNTSNLWCNLGWPPYELARTMYRSGHVPPAVSLGPGIREAIDNGDLDLEELRRGFTEHGINLII